jgi:ubiquinone/menaquinone biosynthesis C-methylase UbiE
MYLGTDLSKSMIGTSKANLAISANANMRSTVADGFNFPLRHDINFNVIHISSVLHHFVGSTIYSSSS